MNLESHLTLQSLTVLSRDFLSLIHSWDILLDWCDTFSLRLILMIRICLQGKSKSISKSRRPEEITRWINNGRQGLPDIQNVGSFAVAWRKWWLFLQPPSRVAGTELQQVVRDGEKWVELRKGTVNGFFTVIAGLCAWSVVAKTDEESKELLEMIKDLYWVQEQMISGLQS
jgi:hypothetical protein